jgi:ABC-type antimicrobial peptide transport system permease subunit
LISEKNFVSRFSAAGFRAFLIDAPVDGVDLVDKELSRGLQDRGFEVVPAWRRLADFMAVENTYLGIFQALGGLGLLLGSAGLAIVVLRNVSERRGELALLRAVGFRKRDLQRMVFGEHALLISSGLVIGLAASAIAIFPALQSPGVHLPVRLLACVVAGLGIGGLAWSWIAASVALRRPLIDSLRSE